VISVFNFEPGFKSAGLAKLGDEQLEWMEKDVKGLSASTPIVVFAHLPLWTVYQEWGWGTEDAPPRARLSQALRVGDGAQRPHPPDPAKGRGERLVPHRAVDRIPAAGGGKRARSWADEGAGRGAALGARRADARRI
jgi:hypothetical protein